MEKKEHPPTQTPTRGLFASINDSPLAASPVFRRLGMTFVFLWVLGLLFGILSAILPENTMDSDVLLGVLLLCGAAFLCWPFRMSPGIGVLIRRLAITSVLGGLLDVVLSILLARISPRILNRPYDGLGYALVWGSLFFSWPYLSRRLGFLNFLKKPKSPRPDQPAVTLSPGRRLFRYGLVIVGISLVVVLVVVLAFGPSRVSAREADSAHDSVRIGMTVPEVVHSVHRWRFLTADSAFPHDDGDSKSAVRLFDSDKLPESQAIALLHEKLHDGYEWRFTYRYISTSPVHFFFTVVIGPDGPSPK